MGRKQPSPAPSELKKPPPPPAPPKPWSNTSRHKPFIEHCFDEICDSVALRHPRRVAERVDEIDGLFVTLQSELSESQARVKFLEWRMRDLCKTLQTTHLNKADLVMLGMTLEEELEKP